MFSFLSGGAVRATLASLIFVIGSATVVAQQDSTTQFDKLYGAGKFKDAEALAQRVLAQQSSASAKATWMHNLAMAYDGQGRYRDAEPLYRQSLALLERTLGKDHANVALSLSNLGNTLSNLSKFDEAEQLYKRSMMIREKNGGPDNPELLSDLVGLAGVQYARGRYDEVEPLYTRSLALLKKLLGKDRPEIAAVLSNLAALYQAQGRYEQAEQTSLQAMRMREKLLGKEHPEVAQSLNNLAALYTEQTRYVDAVLLYQKSLAISRKSLGTRHPDVGNTLNNLASLYLSQARLDDAEKLASEAADIFRAAGGDFHVKLSSALSQLADLKRRKGQYQEAASIYAQALDIQEKAFGPGHVGTGELLANLSICAAGLNHFDEAEQQQARALAILEERLGRDHPKIQTVLNQILLSRLVNEQFTGAEELANRAIAIGEAHRSRLGELSASYRWRAEARWHAGQQDEALRDMTRAMDLLEQQSHFAIGTEHEQSAAFSSDYDLYVQAAQWQVEKGRTPEAFVVAERGRARIFLKQLDLSGVDLFAGIPENESRILRKREADARTRLAESRSRFNASDDASAPSEGRDPAKHARLLSEVDRAQEQYLEVYRTIRNASSTYRITVAQDRNPVSLGSLQVQLARTGSMLLQYVVGEQRSFVFSVPPVGDARVTQLSANSEIAENLGIEPGELTHDKLAKALTWDGKPIARAFTAADPTPELLKRLSALWEVLVPEVDQKAIEGKDTRHLVVVTDGPLHMLPFDALVVDLGDNLRYVLDVGPAISYAPSATVLDNLSRRPRLPATSRRESVLSVADPLYQSTAPPSDATDVLAATRSRSRYTAGHGRLQALPNSRLESLWLAESFAKNALPVERLEKASATEAAVRARITGRSIIHFACHGTVDEQFGNTFGALALTPGKLGASSTSDDGFLTLAEINDLDLKGCELAILSACETNYGPRQLGEGAFALSRGFMVAGSRRVVASNWLVDDEAAASLISVLGSGIAQRAKFDDVDYADALHVAKKWVRDQEKWRSPYYWAMFALIGPN